MSAAAHGGGEALAEALEYVEAGYAVAPVTIRLGPDGKKRPTFHTDWQYPEPGEVAYSRDPDQVMAWAREHPGCGFHAPCGPNGIVVVDADVSERNDGPAAWRAALGPRSPMAVRTQSGGRHLHFRAPADAPIRNSSKAIAGVPGVDVRGEGGTVFTSGTHVHGGGDYVAERIVPVGELPELSDRWAERLRAAGPSGPTRERRRERPAQAPARPRVVKASSVHGREWIEARVEDELRELRRGPGNFRARLFAAAAIGYRAVGCGVLDQTEVEDRLDEAIRLVWGHGPDADDLKWVGEAQDEALADPWRVAREDPEPSPERAQDGLEGAEAGGDGRDGADEPVAASWAPVDLGPHLDGTHVAPAASYLERDDGVALLYAGLVHWLYGESESGKSWVCLVAVVRVLAAGGRALIVDYESDAGAVVGRLRALGAEVEAIRTGLVYVRPEVSCAQEPSSFAELLAQPFDVAVVDGVTEGLGMEGGASVDNDDVTAWARRIPRRIAQQTGAAVACVDHVTKSAEGRGRFPLGGQAKLAVVDGAGYLVEPESAIRPGAKGEVVLRVAKDRPGAVRASSGEWRASDRTQEAARITLDATDPDAIAVTIAGPSERAKSGPEKFRPTVYMERVSAFLASTQGEVASGAIEKQVDGRAEMVRKALDELAQLGYVTRRQGPRNAVLYTFVRRYTELQRVARDGVEAPLPGALIEPDEDHDEDDDD